VTRSEDKLKIVLIGHVVSAATAIELPDRKSAQKQLVALHNFTRVVTDDDKLVDHVALLKQWQGVPSEQPFSVWEMYLCSGLLLGSHLERLGHDVKIVNWIDSDNAQDVFRDINEFQPDIVALSTTFILSPNQMSSVGTWLRSNIQSAFLLAGGHHIFTTLKYLDADQRVAYLENSGFDGFVNDTQGEDALVNLTRNFPNSLARVVNLLWKDVHGDVHENTCVSENNDVNETPILIDPSYRDSVVHIRTARSCGFKCAFCSYPTIAGPLSLMNLDIVIETLRQAKESGVKAVFFVDDTFNVPRERFEELIDRMIAEDLDLPWYSFLRCQYIDEPLVVKMRKSGCAGVFLGIESGSDQILNNMKKGAIVGFYWDGIRWLRENGITTVGSFLIGFPGETEETVEETRNFIEQSGLDYYFIQPFYYLHHTPVHKNAEKFGLSGNGLYWSHDTMDWRSAVKHINRLFLDIENTTFINPDYTLWEIAYLRTKGLTDSEIKDYRVKINNMTRNQMTRFGMSSSAVSSRSA